MGNTIVKMKAPIQIMLMDGLMPAHTAFNVEAKYVDDIKKLGGWIIQPVDLEDNDDVNLADMGVQELKELAETLGVTVKKGTKRTQLISIIQDLLDDEDDNDENGDGDGDDVDNDGNNDADDINDENGKGENEAE